ncbi:SDR family NAD(P)-dependent oxidoreductase [Nocardia asteroides]|uniref:Oxidoreductase n=1 Tax=Nocardia asteroides NBRC 15531 TaxID=1110697 RepID=U5E8D6_NOCAS|nr:SDR family NAD(P)-dependent oxidoreductase [Nocardia asteroides]UGT46759.1 SDR family oxidoreductase [Nocardia asteroides]GAD81439.1 putative oxidoreductase [Nocardia asteroides NBRC 15531]SFN64347.1 Short-chain dehydrogenase [Nocardia asteroides]VEG34389.1 Sorbitol dehydrogenase [Nocardia asteroides]
MTASDRNNDAKFEPSLGDAFLDRTVVPGYSRLGIAVRRRSWPDDDPAPGSMRGRRAVITGANSGIGFAVADGLAGLGATVVLAVRNAGRGADAADRLRERHPDAPVTVVGCDVAEPDSVRRCAAELGETPIDVLVHNAGVLSPERRETGTGHELTFATHVLGPLLLTELVRPLLAAARGARVVLMSSGGMYAQPLVVDDPEYRRGEYRGAAAYARTKRMQVALTPLLAAELGEDHIGVHAVHPGWVDTPGIADALPRFRGLTRPLLRTPAEGADTAVWLAATRNTLPSGRFWHDRKIRPEHLRPGTRYTEADVTTLWRECRALIGVPDQ